MRLTIPRHAAVESERLPSSPTTPPRTVTVLASVSRFAHYDGLLATIHGTESWFLKDSENMISRFVSGMKGV